MSVLLTLDGLAVSLDGFGQGRGNQIRAEIQHIPGIVETLPRFVLRVLFGASGNQFHHFLELPRSIGVGEVLQHSCCLCWRVVDNLPHNLGTIPV